MTRRTNLWVWFVTLKQTRPDGTYHSTAGGWIVASTEDEARALAVVAVRQNVPPGNGMEISEGDVKQISTVPVPLSGERQRREHLAPWRGRSQRRRGGRNHSIIA